MRSEPLKQRIQTKCEERAVDDRSKGIIKISLIEAVSFFKLKKIKNQRLNYAFY